MDSLILSVAIGFVFVFGTFALLTSTLTEMASRFFGLRGEYLLRGIRSMVDGGGHFELPDFRDLRAFLGKRPRQPASPDPTPNVTRVLTNAFVASSAQSAGRPDEPGNSKLSRRERRALPSYISSGDFARAILDIAVPDAAGTTTFAGVSAAVDGLPAGPLRERMRSLVAHADGSTAVLRRSIEQWYDAQMLRVSGWYKRHVRWITVAVAAALALAFNVNAVQIGDALYGDQALRESVVTQAFDRSSCPKRSPDKCLDAVRERIAAARGGGLPIGWGVVTACGGTTGCSWAERHGVTDPNAGVLGDLRAASLLLVGYLLMVLATLPGARFWFDLLGRLGSLRETGPKPPDVLPDRGGPPPEVTVLRPGPGPSTSR